MKKNILYWVALIGIFGVLGWVGADIMSNWGK